MWIKIEEYFWQQEGGVIIKVSLILVIKYQKGKSIFISNLQPAAGTRSNEILQPWACFYEWEKAVSL